MKKRLLIVAHAPSPNTRAMAHAVWSGARSEEAGGVEARLRRPWDAGVEDVLAADGVILGTTENLAYMSGAMKDFFDRVYYGVIGEKQGMPYALYISAGSDGTGTAKGVERIITGLRWRAAQDPLILKGPFQEACLEDLHDLGLAMAMGLDAGVF